MKREMNSERVEDNQLRPGEYVTLPMAGSRRRVEGLVHDYWEEEGERFLQLYSYRTRSVTTYSVSRRKRLRPLPGASVPDSGTGLLPEEQGRPFGTLLPGFLLIGSLLILVFLLLPLIQGGFQWVRVSLTSYEGFLESEMRLSRLVSTVATRVEYRRDLDEYWSAPQDVWASRSGDCEDHAMLIAAYLRHRDIPYTIFGLSLGEELQGHVAVVARTAGGPVLLDPTLATAPDGLRRFPPGTPLRKIVDRYGTLPGRIYPENPEPGRPEAEGFVE